MGTPKWFIISHASLGADSLKDGFIEECALIRSDMLESDLSVEGEFLSEKAMREDNGFSELLSSHKNQQYLLFVTPWRPSPGPWSLDAFRTKIAAIKADARKSPRTLMRTTSVWWFNTVFHIDGRVKVCNWTIVALTQCVLSPICARNKFSQIKAQLFSILKEGQVREGDAVLVWDGN